MPFPDTKRIWILHGNHDTLKILGYDEIRAGRRLSIMTARFKRHIKSRSGGISPAIGKSIDFRMGPAIKFVPSFTDDFAVFYKLPRPP